MHTFMRTLTLDVYTMNELIVLSDERKNPFSFSFFIRFFSVATN